MPAPGRSPDAARSIDEATESRARAERRSCSAGRSRSLPTARPRPSTARKEGSRWPGTRSSSKSDALTRWFATRCTRRARASVSVCGGSPSWSSGPCPASSSENFAAQSAAGTTCRRIAFGQRPEQAGDELVAHPRHLPVEAVGAEPREQGQRHDDGHAVIRRPRLEAVRELQRLIALAPAGREVAGVGARVVRDEVGLAHREQLRASSPRHPATSARTSARRTRRPGCAPGRSRRPLRRRRGCRGGARAPRPSRAGAAARGSRARRR